MLSSSEFFGVVRPAPEANLHPETVPLLKYLGTDVSIKDAFMTLGLHEDNPLAGDLAVVLKKLHTAEKDYHFWDQHLKGPTPDPPNNLLPGHSEAKSQAIHFTNTKNADRLESSRAAYRSSMSTLHTERQAVSKYFGKDEFKTWLDHAVTKSGGGSPTDGAYQTFSSVFGVPEAATILELSLWRDLAIDWTPGMDEMSRKARVSSGILLEGQFDHWYSLGINSARGVVEHLSPSKEGDFEVPYELMRGIIRTYDNYFICKISRGPRFK
jgi:hypothetical protein